MARRSKAIVQLRLYVAGNAPNSLAAITNIKSLCAEHFAGRSTLEVVDLLLEPLRADADAVVVTPTLLRIAPRPGQRVIGNLSDRARVLQSLEAR